MGNANNHQTLSDIMDLNAQDIQTKLDEMTAYADSLAQGLPCLPKDIEVLREANARLARENHEMLEQMFQTAVGLLSTYGKFACMHPEELLMYLKNELKNEHVA